MQPEQIPFDDTELLKLDDKRKLAAEYIREAMEARKISKLDFGSSELVIRTFQTNVCRDSLLCLNCENTALEWSIGDGEEGSYIHGDFNHWWYKPTVSDVIYLLDSWEAIKQAFAKHDDRVRQAASIVIE